MNVTMRESHSGRRGVAPESPYYCRGHEDGYTFSRKQFSLPDSALSYSIYYIEKTFFNYIRFMSWGCALQLVAQGHTFIRHIMIDLPINAGL